MVTLVKMLNMRFVLWSIYRPVVRPDCIRVMHTEAFTALVCSLRVLIEELFCFLVTLVVTHPSRRYQKLLFSLVLRMLGAIKSYSPCDYSWDSL